MLGLALEVTASDTTPLLVEDCECEDATERETTEGVAE